MTASGERWPPGIGKLTGMIRRRDGVVLVLHLDGNGVTVWLPVQPGGRAAIRYTAALRRMHDLDIDLTYRPARCRLSASIRYPVEHVLPLAAALAVAAAGVPTVVRIDS